MRRLTRRQRVSAAVLTVVALLFVTLDLAGGALGGARSGVSGALGSLYRGTDGVLGPARRWAEGVPTAGVDQSRIQQLRAENTRLRSRLTAGRVDARTAAELTRLQRAADGRDHHLIPARVVGFGPGQGFDWTVVVDRGTRDGVRAGQTVIADGALAGRVVSASTASARVLLAADPGSGVGARDLRSGEIGVTTGRGPRGPVFRPLAPTAVVRVGDRIVTGPDRASSYVAGLAVGRVTAVSTGQDGSVTAILAPAVSPTSLDLVGVLTAAGPDNGTLAADGTGQR